MEKEKSNEENKKELHLLIDSSTNNLVKSLKNIVDALKFEPGNVQSSGNVEINENMDLIANEINTLLNMVNKMKLKEINNHENEKINENYNKTKKIVSDSLKKLIDINENVENQLCEMKKNPFANALSYISPKK